MTLTLQVLTAGGDVIEAAGEDEVFLVYEPALEEGDRVSFACSEQGRHVVVQLDDTMPPALLYYEGERYELPVPNEEQRRSYSPRAFTGERHLLYARAARPEEVAARRNLALNPLDYHGNASLYPHTKANVETRGESVFASRNAVDGVKANTDHGHWPYTSWGINRDPAACWRIEFGRPVRLDAAGFYLRADFPHDAWWTSATLHFSGGESLTVPLEKTGALQLKAFPPRVTEWVELDTLIKADDPSPFPALTQLELYGTEA